MPSELLPIWIDVLLQETCRHVSLFIWIPTISNIRMQNIKSRWDNSEYFFYYNVLVKSHNLLAFFRSRILRQAYFISLFAIFVPSSHFWEFHKKVYSDKYSSQKYNLSIYENITFSSEGIATNEVISFLKTLSYLLLLKGLFRRWIDKFFDFSEFDRWKTSKNSLLNPTQRFSAEILKSDWR